MQGKPRLRKLSANDRDKLHLPQLVLAIARLPALARSRESGGPIFRHMSFTVLHDDGTTITICPTSVTFENRPTIDLSFRFNAIASDENSLEAIRLLQPELVGAIEMHLLACRSGKNTSALRTTADAVMKLQSEEYGSLNSSISTLMEIDSKPVVDLEENIIGKEGRLRIRTHVYKERDRTFTNKVKRLRKQQNAGVLECEVCTLRPVDFYGEGGEKLIEAHHRIPISELEPDSITRPEDMAMVCSNCHTFIHSQNPCLTIEEAKAALLLKPDWR